MTHEVTILRDIGFAHPNGKPLLADLYLPRRRKNLVCRQLSQDSYIPKNTVQYPRQQS